MDFQHAISVPTKQPAESGGGGTGKILRDGRRQSSDSVGSFDVAASLFSSMQALERSGRSFSSLLTGGSTADLIGLSQAAAPANMRGRVPVGGHGTRMSIGEGYNNLALPSNNFMQLYPSAPMGRSLSHSDLDMEALFLQQQQRKLGGQLFQAPQLDVAGGRGGYLPSASKRGSLNSVDDFTTQELISELSRRRSERSRASAALNMLSAENQPRMQSTNTRRRSSASTDSLDLLANTANTDMIKEKGTGEESTGDEPKTNPSNGNVSGTLAVMDIATCYNPSKKKRKEENMQSDTSDGEDEAGKSEGKKAKRNPSTSSIDILLTALNDDLQKLEKKDNEKEKEKVPKQLQGESADQSQRRLSKESLLSNVSDEMICQPVTNEQDDLARNRKAHLALLLNSRPSLTTASLASESDLLYPTQDANFDYARRLQLSNSMMASLEYSMLRNDAMLRNDFAMRQLAMRDMQQREIESRLAQNDLRRGPAVPRTLPGNFMHATPPLPEDPIYMQQQQHAHVRLPSSGSGNMASSNRDKSIQDKEGNETPHNAPIQKTVSPPLQWKKAEEEPVKIPPKEALNMFLKAYGEKGENSRDDMLKAIGETERSLAIIHSWDRSQGLRKCHSRTVVKTRRSRAMIKAFLTGVEAPKEPHRNRKRPKKNNKKVSDGFGAPLRHW